MRFDGKTNQQRITGFKMTRIASVTRPAQEGALAFIAKRKGEPDYDPSKPKGKSNSAAPVIEKSSAFLITSSDAGHAHGLRIWDDENGGETTNVEIIVPEIDGTIYHSHPWSIGPDGSIVIGENLGHNHEVESDAVMVALASFLKAHPEGFQASLFPSNSNGGNLTKLMGRLQAFETTKENSMAKPAEKTSDDLTKAQATAKRWESIAGLTAKHREHFDGLEGDASDAFLAKSETDRESEVSAIETNKAAADPVIYTATDGTEYRKSDGALATFAKRDDKREKEMAVLRTEKADLTFAKAAATHLEKLGGTDDDHTALMKAISTIEDEPQRIRIIGSIKGAASNLAKSMNRIGSTGADDDVEESDGVDDAMAKLAKTHAKEKGISVSKAHSDLMRNSPEMRKLYREANPETAAMVD